MAFPVFQLIQVEQRFAEVLALKNISLTITAGERIALIGPSGAGKSTLLGLLNGSLSPTMGDVVVMGENLNRLSGKQRRRIQRRIGTIYQQHHLVTNLSVIHNVNAGHLGYWSFWRSAVSLIWPQEVESVRLALEQMGIPEKIYERADRLSGGQQQRVAIARVLVQNPMVLLADEPTSSVDPERSREVMDLLRHLNQTAGKTLVMSLHDLDFAWSHCDRILGLRQGQIQFDAPASQVTEDMIAALYRL